MNANMKVQKEPFIDENSFFKLLPAIVIVASLLEFANISDECVFGHIRE